MSVSEVSIQDGALFAESIRGLALQAHEMLQGSASEQEIRNLLEQIDGLEEAAGSHGSDELGRWLSSLRRVVEEQVMASI
jgi:hypothetical protein